MTTALSNPQDRAQIKYPIETTREALKFIVYLDYNYKLTISDDNSNKYSFESRKFLADGAFIDITLISVSDPATEMTIEVRKMPGAFEKTRETKSAANHISDIGMLLANIFKLTPEQKEKYKGAEASVTAEKGLKEYSCTNCKKTFYANRKVTPIAVCPHCKTRNLTNTHKDSSGWGQIISLAFSITNMFRKGR